MTLQVAQEKKSALTLLESVNFAAGLASRSALRLRALYMCTLYRIKPMMRTAATPPPTAPPMTPPFTPPELCGEGLAVFGVLEGVRLGLVPLEIAETPVTVAFVTFAPTSKELVVTSKSRVNVSM